MMVSGKYGDAGLIVCSHDVLGDCNQCHHEKEAQANVKM